MKHSIVQTGDPVLRQKAKPVAKKEFGSRELATLVRNMSKLLAEEKFGVALAAPQVGVSKRLFVVAGRAFVAEEAHEEDEEIVIPPDMLFINPEIIRTSRKKNEMSEGCLSVRGSYGTVLRHERASVRAFTIAGKPFIYHGSGLVAQIFQHEIDHLDGILYTDKAEKVQHESERAEV